MIPQELPKSSNVAVAAARRMPAYGWVGLASLVVFQALLFTTDNAIVGWFFTPIQWTGLILFLDGLRKRRRGKSLAADHPGELLLLGIISIGSWLVFEAYNLMLNNWVYVGLPENPWVRFPGYLWAFATISPGMFLIYETLSDLLPGDDHTTYPRLPNHTFWPFVVFGAACLVVPFVWPSPYMTPLVWMGFAFFLDPINGRLGERSILSEFFTGRFRSMLVFFLAGLTAGLLWEFWNYWATTKWEYTFPMLRALKIFEMPIAGFLGFPPFCVEYFVMFHFIALFFTKENKLRI